MLSFFYNLTNIRINYIMLMFSRISSVNRASGFYPDGREFESLMRGQNFLQEFIIICPQYVIILKWSATFITLIGAILTSLRIDPMNIYFLNFGSFIFLLWAFAIRDRAMIVVNSGLLLIYMMGVIIGNSA